MKINRITKKLFALCMTVMMLVSMTVPAFAGELPEDVQQLGSVDEHVHSYEAIATVLASCTAEGMMTYTCACTDSYTEIIPVAAHSYGESVVVAAGCEADGSSTAACSVCGAEKVDVIPAAGHSYGEAVVLAASCTADGSMTYTCTVEGCGFVYTETIPATGHSLVENVCSVCSAVGCTYAVDCLAGEHNAECAKAALDKIASLLAQLPLADDMTDENFDSVKAVVDQIRDIDEYHRLVWRGHEYEMLLWNTLQADANYVEVADIIDRGVLMLAANKIASVNDTEYDNLQDAINAAAGGGTVVLLDNIELSEGANVPAGASLTLDLNGKTLSGNTNSAGSSAVITNNGTLTIKDSVGGGKITAFAQKPDTSAEPSYANNSITNCGTLTLQSGTIENTTESGRACYPIDNNSTSRDAIVNIQGGTVTGRGAIRQFANSTTNRNEVNITGGTVLGTSYGVWVQNPSDGGGTTNNSETKASLNINGGSVSKVLLEPSQHWTFLLPVATSLMLQSGKRTPPLPHVTPPISYPAVLLKATSPALLKMVMYWKATASRWILSQRSVILIMPLWQKHLPLPMLPAVQSLY